MCNMHTNVLPRLSLNDVRLAVSLSDVRLAVLLSDITLASFLSDVSVCWPSALMDNANRALILTRGINIGPKTSAGDPFDFWLI